jgi:hypothetical protein
MAARHHFRLFVTLFGLTLFEKMWICSHYNPLLFFETYPNVFGWVICCFRFVINFDDGFRRYISSSKAYMEGEDIRSLRDVVESGLDFAAPYSAAAMADISVQNGYLFYFPAARDVSSRLT